MSKPEAVSQSPAAPVAKATRHPTNDAPGSRAYRLRAGDAWFPIRGLDETGFTLDIAFAPKLRGRVEIHDSRGLLRSGLIFAAAPRADGMRYEFKRISRPLRAPPRDYVGAEPWDAPSPG